MSTTKNAQKGDEISDSRKVLIVVRGFVPYEPSLGGVIRIIKLASFLRSRGHQVFIVAAKGQFVSDFGYADEASHFRITYYLDKTQEQYSKKYNSISSTPNSPPNSLARSLKSFLTRLARKLVIPDPGVLFIWFQYRAARTLIKSERISNVIVSSPAHSSQLTGYLLKKRFRDKINLIIDYRDSWNCCGFFAANGAFSRYVSRKMELAVLHSCDQFVYVSTPMLSKIQATFFDISKKATLVMNGYDLSMQSYQSPTTKSGATQMRFGYFGRANDTVGSGYDPSLLLEALSEYRDKICIDMFGPITISNIDQWNSRSSVTLHGSIRHPDALKKMQTMDALVMIYTGTVGTDEIVSGKLFEYMLARRPIFIIGPDDMEAKKIVLKKKIGYWADSRSILSIKTALGAIYNDWKSKDLPNYSLRHVAEFDRRCQFSKILPLLR